MAGTETAFTPPPWVGWVVVGSAALAILSHLVGGSGTTRLTGLFTATFLAGVLYLLYLWGQHREPPRNGGDDGKREKEMQAEAGGYGGSGGGS